MYFIVYETTNKANGRKYRGAHRTNNINDDYLGSGFLLLKAIEKYGVDNFERTILKICKDVESMFIAEAEFVNEDWVKDPTTYNLKIGGEGGWDFINREGKRWNEEKRRLHSIEMKKKREAGVWGPKNGPCKGFLGRKHSIDTRNKISENNGSRLTDTEIENRLIDVKSIDMSKRGAIAKLAIKWKVSHTQVRRFIKNLSACSAVW